MPIEVLVRGRTSPARCAVCHDEAALPPLTSCLRCGSAAHEECLLELSGCPTLACAEGARRPVRLEVRGGPGPLAGYGLQLRFPFDLLLVLGIVLILLITAVTHFRNALNNTFDSCSRKVDPSITVPIGG